MLTTASSCTWTSNLRTCYWLETVSRCCWISIWHAADLARWPARLGRGHSGIHVARAVGRCHRRPRGPPCSWRRRSPHRHLLLGRPLVRGTRRAHCQVPSPASAAHHFNPRVSPGLSDIIQKCLSRPARDRYRDASAFANDLRRHLNHLPLEGVRNRSLVNAGARAPATPGRVFRGLILWGVAASVLLSAFPLASRTASGSAILIRPSKRGRRRWKVSFRGRRCPQSRACAVAPYRRNAP